MTAREQQPVPGYTPEDANLAQRLVAENYETLLAIARSKRRRAGIGETLRTTDLLHESYLKLDGASEWRSEEHFIRAATLAMRHVIVDYARRKLSDKRGGGGAIESFDEERDSLPEFSESPEDLLAINALMAQLADANPRWMRVVDARYFAGMTEDEAAHNLSVSPRTVRRDWKAARGWIAQRMGVAA